MDVDVKALPVPELIKYANSVGVKPFGMSRQQIIDEVEAVTAPVVAPQENQKIVQLETKVEAMIPVIEQLQTEMKQVRIATGLAEAPKEKKDD